MTYRMTATHVSVEDDGTVVTVGFTDGENAPMKYVLLQKQHDCDDQDRRLGLDRIYLEIEDQSRSVHGGMKAINLGDDRLTIQLDDRSCLAIEVVGGIEITLARREPNTESALTKLEEMAKADGVRFARA